MKPVEKITLTDKELKETPKDLLTCYELTNSLIDRQLCGLEFTLENGWKISFRNNRFAKQIGVPM